MIVADFYIISVAIMRIFKKENNKNHEQKIETIRTMASQGYLLSKLPRRSVVPARNPGKNVTVRCPVFAVFAVIQLWIA